MGEVQQMEGVSAVVSQRMRSSISYAQPFEKAEISTLYTLRTANQNERFKASRTIWAVH